VTAEVLRPVEAHLAAEARKFLGDRLRDAVHCDFVVARRFDFD
jgi:hypothetical protein